MTFFPILSTAPQIWNFIYPKTQKRTQKHFGNWGLNKGQFLLMDEILKLPNPSKAFPTEAKRFLDLRYNQIKNRVFAFENGKNDKKYAIEVESR